jgi:RNase P subunit RPR2
MSREYCPKCKRMVNVEEAVVRRQTGLHPGEEEVVRTYHCEECGAFLRSEKTRAETGRRAADSDA